MKRETKEIKNVKDYLSDQGFVCSSHPSSEQMVYSKDNNIIIIKRNGR